MNNQNGIHGTSTSSAATDLIKAAWDREQMATRVAERGYPLKENWIFAVTVGVIAVVVMFPLVGWIVIVVTNWIPKYAQWPEGHGDPYTASATVLLVIATIVLVVVTAGLACFAVLELKEARTVHALEFLLRIDQMFQASQNIKIANDIAANTELHKYQHGETSKTSIEDWNDLRRYMGLFERIEMLLEMRTIEIEHVSDVYYSKLQKIVADKEIYHHILKNRREGWRRLEKLWLWVVAYRREKGAEIEDPNDFALRVRREETQKEKKCHSSLKA
jgi:hypothetical protein